MANDCVLILSYGSSYFLVNLPFAVHIDGNCTVKWQVATRMAQIGLPTLESPLLSFHIPNTSIPCSSCSSIPQLRITSSHDLD